MRYEEIMRVINGLDEHTYECMGKVIFGHEVWIENAVKHMFNKYSADLLYGHNMHTDGTAPKEYINPTVFDAEGNHIKCDVDPIKDGYRVSFKGNGKAPYTMYNETIPVIWNKIKDGKWKAGVKRDYTDVDSSASYQMYAKIVFTDGAPSKLEQTVLEIVPDNGKMKVGSDTVFKVLYEGKPLAGKELKFYSKVTGEESFANTDANGKATLKVTNSGEWMILMRYKDTAKAVADEFDETVYIHTIVMKAE